MSITIRYARQDEAPQIANLIIEAMNRDCCAWFYGEGHTLDEWRRFLITLIQAKDTQHSYLNTLVAIPTDSPTNLANDTTGQDNNAKEQTNDTLRQSNNTSEQVNNTSGQANGTPIQVNNTSELANGTPIQVNNMSGLANGTPIQPTVSFDLNQNCNEVGKEPQNLSKPSFVAGVLVSYDGAQLHSLREPFFRGVKQWFGRDVSSIPDETAAGELYYDSLAVHPLYRHQGIATALLRAGILRAQALGIDKVGLLVDKGNPRAERLYRQVGFRQEGENQWGGHPMLHLTHPVNL